MYTYGLLYHLNMCIFNLKVINVTQIARYKKFWEGEQDEERSRCLALAVCQVKIIRIISPAQMNHLGGRLKMKSVINRILKIHQNLDILQILHF